MGFAKTEPVRLYLYGLAAPVLALLVYFGLVSTDAVPLYLAVAGAVLLVPAVESARSAVVPNGAHEAAVAVALQTPVADVNIELDGGQDA
jgi:hypothetical protein